MTEQLRTLAEAAVEGYATSPNYPEYWAFVDGFIAGRTSAADEIEAERLDADWEAPGQGLSWHY